MDQNNKKIVIPRALIILPGIIIAIATVFLIFTSIKDKLNNETPIIIAFESVADKNFLKLPEGEVSATWLENSSDRSTFDLLADNEAEGTITNPVELISLNQKGLNLKIVAILNCDQNRHGLITQPDIRDASQLSEKKIGIQELNSFSHYFTLQVLQGARISEEDVTLEHLQVGSPIDALKQNLVQAAYADKDMITQATSEGFNVIRSQINQKVSTCTVLTAKAEVIKSKESQIKRLISASRDAKIILDEEASDNAFEKMKTELHALQDFLSSSGDSAMDAKELIDDRFF
jgi:ABC-type nitrate/sulfonate/bicarbonate transport system substrate-binding protein